MERAVVVLRFYEDLGERETAAALGIAIGTVRSTCFRALAKLRVSPLLRPSPDRPPAADELALSCPDSLPDPPANTGPGLAVALVPFAARVGLVCTYPPGGPLTGVARLTATELDGLLARLDTPEPPRTPRICTNEYGVPFAIRVAGAGRSVTLRLEPYGCGISSS